MGGAQELAPEIVEESRPVFAGERPGHRPEIPDPLPARPRDAATGEEADVEWGERIVELAGETR